MKEVSETKERILTTAARLFHQHGYNLTGINQVIDEARVAKASLYQHFSSKEDLLLEYLRRASDEWFRGLKEFSREARTPRERLLMIFDYRIKLAQESQYSGCNFIKISAEVPKDNEKIFAIVTAHKEAVRRYFYDQVKELEGHDTETGKRRADMLYFLMEGAGVSSTIYHDKWAMEEAREIAKTLI